jgi:hypothetical protein
LLFFLIKVQKPLKSVLVILYQNNRRLSTKKLGLWKEKILAGGLFQFKAGTKGFAAVFRPGSVDFNVLRLAEQAAVKQTIHRFTIDIKVLVGIPKPSYLQIIGFVRAFTLSFFITSAMRLIFLQGGITLDTDTVADAELVMPVKAGTDATFESWHL